jgi:hypothetical protein
VVDEERLDHLNDLRRLGKIDESMPTPRLPAVGPKKAASSFSFVKIVSITLPSDPSLNSWFPFSTGTLISASFA